MNEKEEMIALAEQLCEAERQYNENVKKLRAALEGRKDDEEFKKLLRQALGPF